MRFLFKAVSLIDLLCQQMSHIYGKTVRRWNTLTGWKESPMTSQAITRTVLELFVRPTTQAIRGLTSCAFCTTPMSAKLHGVSTLFVTSIN